MTGHREETNPAEPARDPAARRFPEPSKSMTGPFVVDLERIQFSPYFSRLSAVTQVVSPSSPGAPVHNRLTHTLKVSAIARSIALTLNARPEADLPCRPDVVEAAAHSHDLGHPPFGHLGEAVLDRLARTELDLSDGFEGNAQTYRILTTLDVTERPTPGLNLTAAVRVAAAKYPWTSTLSADRLHGRGAPRGVRRREDGTLMVSKYSAYTSDWDDLKQARDRMGLSDLRQSVEGAVMDIADDIAYSVHDIEDFYRAGILDHASIAAEFRGWLNDSSAWRSRDAASTTGAEPGASLEWLRRKMHRDDAWVADDDAFHDAVATVQRELIDDLLALPFDGSLTAERRLAAFTDHRIRTFQQSVRAHPGDEPRSGPVCLSPSAWHEVEVLKFVHKRFVLSRPDLAIHQRGLSRILTRSVRALREWLDDDLDRVRAPRRLRELVALAHDNDRTIDPGDQASDEQRTRRAQARGIVDYVASLSDAQAVALSEAISGRADRLWSVGQRI